MDFDHRYYGQLVHGLLRDQAVLCLQFFVRDGAKSVSIGTLACFNNSRFDFMKWQKPAFIISAIVLVIGLASGFARKDGVFGVDFAGGDSMLYSFQQKVAVEELRSAVGALEVGDAKIAYKRDYGTQEETLEVTTAFDQGEKVTLAIKEQFADAGFVLEKTSRVGGIGRERNSKERDHRSFPGSPGYSVLCGPTIRIFLCHWCGHGGAA